MRHLTLRSVVRTAQRAVPTIDTNEHEYPPPAKLPRHVAPPDASLGGADGAARRPYPVPRFKARIGIRRILTPSLPMNPGVLPCVPPAESI